MRLHLPSLLVLLLLGYGLLGLQLAMARRRLHDSEALRWWIWGNALLLAGHATLLARAVMPAPLSVVGANLLILLGEGAYVAALHRFVDDVPMPRAVRRTGVALVLAVPVLGLLDPAARIVGSSVLLPVPLLWGAWCVWRARRRVEPALWPVGLTLAVVSTGLLWRAADALARPDAYAVQPPDAVQAVILVGSFVALMGAGNGFLLALSERATRTLARMASQDHLTGVLNRQAFDPILDHTLQRARRDGLTVVFVLMDIDHFKLVNDRHGHAFGDEVLRHFARAVRERLRASDVFARYGGEEFALMLPSGDADATLEVLQGLRRAIAEIGLLTDDGQPFRVTFSAGVALSPRGSVDAGGLYRAADRALYEAKRAGRDRDVLADPGATIGA